MNTDPQPTQPEPFPLPKGMKHRAPRFGANPVSPLVPAAIGENGGHSSEARPEFKICWEDQKQGLTLVVQERENGRLIAEVLCTNASLPQQAAVSVGLVGTAADHLIRKTIPLGMPENNGRRGSVDFGPLTEAVKELGPRLGVVMFLLV
jgi:hypothetical protein